MLRFPFIEYAIFNGDKHPGDQAALHPASLHRVFKTICTTNKPRWEAIALRLEAIAMRLEVIAIRLEAIILRLEAVAHRLEAMEAIAMRLEVGGHHS